MKKKRLIATLASVAVVATMFAGCGSSSTDKAKEGDTAKPGSDIKFGMATDEGGLGDKSFNDAANTGLEKIKGEEGNKVQVVESHSADAYEPNLRALVSGGNNLTFAIGFKMEKEVEKVAKDNTDKDFAIVDAVVDQPNVKSIVFKENEGSFLMGVIAGKATKTNKVAFIGGVESPLIEKFEAGYIAGVKAVNPEAAEDLINRKMVKYAGTFGDSSKGYELGKALYNDGADIVYHAAGGVGLGLFKAAKEMNKSAIGVDKDQALELEEYKDVIISSMVKRVDVGVYNVCKEYIDGNFKGGKDNVFVMGLKEDGVGIAETSKDTVSEEILQLAEKYKKEIVDEKIKVPETIEDVKSFEAPKL